MEKSWFVHFFSGKENLGIFIIQTLEYSEKTRKTLENSGIWAQNLAGNPETVNIGGTLSLPPFLSTKVFALSMALHLAEEGSVVWNM